VAATLPFDLLQQNQFLPNNNGSPIAGTAVGNETM
jgi:hypothetical protein